jgi:DegV family protein with EDD domain
MPNLHIVTDSCAHFTTANYAQRHPVTIVPNKITIAGKTYREGVDLSAEEAFRLMAHQPYAPQVQSPTVAEFAETYTRLLHHYDSIISIHPSREIYSSWQNARAAAQQVAAHNKIMVIDSQSISAAQGLLVQAAVKALEQQPTPDDLVRVLRGAAERLYLVIYVETMDYLATNQVMPPSQTILGSMLGLKPFLTIENGRLIPMEKVRTRVQAIERLVEYAVEFTDIDDAVILQPKPFMSDQTRMLQDRLSVEFPGRHFPYILYGPSLAALVGRDATGLVVLESEISSEDDEF